METASLYRFVSISDNILFVCVTAEMDSSASKKLPSISSEVGPLVDHLSPLISQGTTLRKLWRAAKKIKMERYADARKPVVFALLHFHKQIKLKESATDSSDESEREVLLRTRRTTRPTTKYRQYRHLALFHRGGKRRMLSWRCLSMRSGHDISHITRWLFRLCTRTRWWRK